MGTTDENLTASERNARRHWQYIEEAGLAAKMGAHKQGILKTLIAAEGARMSVMEIAEATGFESNGFRRDLHRLRDHGLVIRLKRWINGKTKTKKVVFWKFNVLWEIERGTIWDRSKVSWG